MAHVKTIGSGKDYATLALWETYAGAQASAAQWGELYSGSDLQPAALTGWTGTPAAYPDCPRLYAAAGHRHDGTSTTNGAYFNSGNTNGLFVDGLNYTRVEGIRSVCAAEALTKGFYLVSIEQGLIDGCVCVIPSTTADGPRAFTASLGTRDASVVIQNCLVYVGAVAHRVYGFQCGGLAVGTRTGTFSVSNCSVHSRSSNAACVAFRQSVAATPGNSATSDVTWTNCIGTVAAGTCFYSGVAGWGGTEVVTETATHNLSSDATADDWDATGCLINQTAADVFVNVASDLHLKAGSPAMAAGADMYATFQTDAIGAARRPSGGFDLGALTTCVGALGYRLYRGVGGVSSVDFGTVVATAYAGQSTRTFASISHEPLTRYTYVLRPVRQDASGTWLETPDVSCGVEFQTDADGQWVGRRPAGVETVEADVLPSAEIRARWQYRTPYGMAAPQEFAVYWATCRDVASATPQIVSFVDDGPYETTRSLADGVAYYIAVAARSSGGVQSLIATVIGPIIARSSLPAQPVVTVEQTF